jgi:flavin reductase (DIM6/NTAB) family NADH-FMN oxidoreductase RutF
MISFDPAALSRREVSDFANAVIAPRPIAWVSTVSTDGRRNLAPFSYFNAFSTAPLTVGVGPGSRDGANKDSLRNIRDTCEFTISSVTAELAAAANRTSADVDPSVDEWLLARVTPHESITVNPSFVAESPASLECQVVQIVDLGDPDVPANSLVIARVTQLHVREDLMEGHLHGLADVLAPVGRLGGDLWCTTGERFVLARPRPEDVLQLLASPDAKEMAHQ